MRKEVITYTDYDGNKRTEEFYFNLNKAEVAEMNLSVKGGYQQMLRRIIADQDGGAVIRTFKDLLFKAYGVKSPDGRRLEKSEALSKEFSETPAYEQLFMDLIYDANKMAEFIREVLPQVDESDLAKAQAEMASDPVLAPAIGTADNVTPIK